MNINRLVSAATLAGGLALGMLGLLGILAPPVQAGGTRYVDSATGSDSSNNCSVSSSPCKTIQHAVDEADPGDLVKVATGTYTGTNSYGGLAQVVYISKTVTMVGGFTTSNWDTPDPVANPTVLDAQGQGRVLYITDDISSTLEGLVITGGDATDLWFPGYRDLGGGIRIISATVTISNCAIYSNTASTATSGYGGGVYVYNATATLIGNTFQGNVASTTDEGFGGGLCLYDSHGTTVSGNVIQSNTASLAGIGNGSGGGVYLWNSDSVDLSGNDILSNAGGEDQGGGGGVFLDHSSASFNSNRILHNYSSRGTVGAGGGLFLWKSSATMTNCIVADNVTLHFGTPWGSITIRDSFLNLVHTTVANNSGSGTGIHVSGSDYSSTLTMTNTIVAGHYHGLIVDTGSVASLDSTLWNGNTDDWSGGGSITRTHDYWGNPVFGTDYHIGSSSAALDRGVDAGVKTDIDGEPRPQWYFPDLGADEAPYTPFTPRLSLPQVLHGE